MFYFFLSREKLHANAALRERLQAMLGLDDDEEDDSDGGQEEDGDDKTDASADSDGVTGAVERLLKHLPTLAGQYVITTTAAANTL